MSALKTLMQTFLVDHAPILIAFDGQIGSSRYSKCLSLLYPCATHDQVSEECLKLCPTNLAQTQNLIIFKVWKVLVIIMDNGLAVGTI